MDNTTAAETTVNEKFVATEKEISAAVACTEQLPAADKDKVKWRLQKFILTYKTHIDKEELEAFLTNVCYEKKCGGIVFLRIAHETADPAAPYPHTHVVVHLEKVIEDQTKGHRLFDWPTLDGNIHLTVTSSRPTSILATPSVILRKKILTTLILRRR